jgi:8-oxo-dGTP diphosphatase
MSAGKDSDGGNQTDVIETAGGLLWRETTTRDRLVAVIHRPEHGDWVLPKGHRDAGERWHEAALREVEEETNCRGEIERFAGCVWYLYKGDPKVVLFWHMRLVGERDFQPSSEVDQLAWLTADEALGRLSHEDERRLLFE